MNTLLTIVIVASTSWFGLPTQGHTAKTYRLSDDSSVKLNVPQDWKESVSTNGSATVIDFGPNDSRNFKLRITAIPIINLKPDSNKPAHLKNVMQQMGQSMMGAAEEKALEIRELKLAKGAGYYFTMTDKTAQLGQRKYMLQGILGIEDVQLFFTFISSQRDSNEESQALEIVKTIQAQK